MTINTLDNKKIYDNTWQQWRDMKKYGAASCWLRALISDILKNISQQEITSILDVGCGEGTTTHFIATQYPAIQIRGVDFSKTGIECAKSAWQLPNLQFIHEDDTTSLKESWDLICCFEVLEHVETWQSLLTAIATASTKYILLSFPTGRMRTFEVNVGHVRNFRQGEVEKFLLQQGFVARQVFYAGFPFYSPIYRELNNLTNAGNNSFTQGEYGFTQKTISAIFYFLFRYLSTRKYYGDQFCGLFERVDTESLKVVTS
ncbi:class I SAM-dependent methyltransferase [Beggiatoa leptomitoformis]|uniref:Methyltransferase domain-containing protein n=1 Tax=Beggiatoa leptomitoformis TaxID=288004 RepID=A0A2N9YH84_9GAMM|nr:class I SAM-dependent methyltransferase [Beggiatoa leptomitoformis]ALG69417.2 methyltransferase domain-containing protein [Beggiatoa leptomitoformis]AUI69921.1 methyltransferase domain-containing protein [Beggiatoa leptomitoformis]